MNRERPPADSDDLVPLLLGAGWHEDQPGGLNRYHAELFTALRRLGLHPRATTLGPAKEAPVGFVTGGGADEPIAVRLWSFAQAAARAKATGVTVVDSHFALYSLWPMRFGRLRHLPSVVHFQGPWAEESVVSGELPDWRIAIKRQVERLTYRRARILVVLSTAFKQILVERYGIAPWHIEVIPPGIDLKRFSPDDTSQARVSLGLPRNAPIAVTVRRLVPRMGLDVMIEAWSQVRGAIPDALLLIVGDGPENDRLACAAVQRGVGSTIRFLGRVDEETLVRCYQAADVSVVPTRTLEGFGLVVLESLACGTPVVVTDSGGLPEAITPLDASLVVPAGDPEALSTRLQAALGPLRALPDRNQCRTHAEAFGWSSIAERHRDVYVRAIGTTPRRPRVVYLDHCARLSGGELALLHLLPSLDVDAHVILGEDGPLVEKLRTVGVSVEVVELPDTAGTLSRDRVRPGRIPLSVLGHTAYYVGRLAYRLRSFGPDLVHTNSLKSALYGGCAAQMASIPVVWHIRDRIADDYLPSAACRLVRAAARVLPAAVIANSKATLATLGEACPCGVAIASPLGFPPPQSPRRPMAKSLRIGIVGRLDRWKGQHLFLEAFAEAFPVGQQEAVIIGAALFGQESYSVELERKADALGLRGRVDFRGFREAVEDELGRLDILVHASIIPEPFGQVVVEGMAVGLPVVAANAGGPAEVITDGVDGLLYPPGDVKALTRALQLLAADPGLRRRLGAAARVRALDFTPERIAPLVMAVYHSVLRAPQTS